MLRAEVDVALDRPAEALPSSRRSPTTIPWRRWPGSDGADPDPSRADAPAEAALLAASRLLPRSVQPRKELVFIYNIQHRQAELDAVLGELLDLDALDYQYVLHWTKTRNTVWNPSGDLPSLERFAAADPEDRLVEAGPGRRVPAA